MRIIPTYKVCKDCKLDLGIDDYYYNETKDRYNSVCRDCQAKKVNKTDRRQYRNQFVKTTWQNCKLTLKGRVILTSQVVEEDIKEIIDEGYGFILRNFEKKGKSVL